MRNVLLVAFTDFKFLLRGRETIVWTFVMPLIFIYFLAVVNRGPVRGAGDVLGALVPPDGGFMAEHILHRLEERGYRIVRASNPGELKKFVRRLEFPPGFTDRVIAAKPTPVQFERVGAGMAGDYDKTRMIRAVYTALADFGLADLETGKVTYDSLKEVAARPHFITVDVKSAGKRRDPPSGFEQAIPGTIVTFALLVSFTTSAIVLMIQRDRGILRRLASTPMSRASIVAGKWGSHWMLALGQIAYAMLVARVVFGLHWGPNLWAIFLVLMCFAALAASLGMLLGNSVDRERQVIGIGVIASSLMGALGGCWWPIEVTPPWAQVVAMALPSGWAMDAMHKLLSFGLPASSVLADVAAMLTVTLLALWLIARRFRFQ